MWAGADATSHSWSAYTGVTLAPFGPIGSDGWRMRAVGGYGAYRYDAPRRISGALRSQPFRGTVSFADVLIGFQKQYYPLTLKAFAGVSATDHQQTPFDAESTQSGLDYGLKAMIEAWFDMNESNWASLNLAWSSVDDTYASRLRLGFTVWPEVSLGLEGAATGNAETGGGRGGAFARYTWGSGEIAASGGPSLDGTMTLGVYGTLNVLTRF
jgi:Cellulose biosynthesis protein BcsS